MATKKKVTKSVPKVKAKPETAKVVKEKDLTERQLLSLDKFSDKIISRAKAKIAKKVARFEKKSKGLGKKAEIEVAQRLKDAFAVVA